MPSPPACAPAPPLPRRSRSGARARERPLERLDRGVERVGHRGVDAAHARRPTDVRPARRRWSRSTPNAAPPPSSTLFIVPWLAAPTRSGDDLRQRAEAHVGDPLAHLDVAGTDRDRRHRGDDDARAARPRRTGRIAPPLAGSVGSMTARIANATALTVTASTALTLPGRCASVPVKSNVTSSPSTRDRRRTMRVGVCCSRPGTGRVEHVGERPLPVGQRGERGAHPPLAVVEDLVEALGRPRARARARPTGRRRARWRRAARRGRPAARRACATRRRRGRATSSSSGVGGRRRPSSSMSSASGGIDPGAVPPTSAWCARLATQPTSDRSVDASTGATSVSR